MFIKTSFGRIITALCVLILIGAFIVTGLWTIFQPKLHITEQLALITDVKLPEGSYYNVAWFSDELLVMSYDETDESGELVRPTIEDLWIVGIDGSNMRPLPVLEDKSQCKWTTFYDSPQRLSDNELMYVRSCHTSTPDGVYQRVLALDILSGRNRYFYEYDLPTWAIHISFSPDHSQAITSPNAGIIDEMFWLDDLGYRPADVGMRRAHNPDWSPDGMQIAFLGTDNLGFSIGPDSALKPDSLWLMPSNCEQLVGGCAGNLTRLISEIYDACRVNWSPNGKWLVFDGELTNGKKGVWLLDLNANQLIKVADGNYRCAEWSPNGRKIVVISRLVSFEENPDDWRDVVSIIDLTAILNQ